ncbi:MAG TPA: hypothetical protein VGJ93_07410 [Desulfuromonadaceae bacterium]|jgi:hypothetical protein
MPVPRPQEIACQQVLVDDASVFSIQSTVLPHLLAKGVTAEFLLDRYLAYIRSFTASIIRPVCKPEGVEFRLLGSSLSLINFQVPVQEGETLVLRISGGLLVQPQQCQRGELSFAVEPQVDGIRVSLELKDYCPLILGSSPSIIRRWLYSFTQAAVHRLVTVRFLAMLYRELSGHKACVKVVRANVRKGRPI